MSHSGFPRNPSLEGDSSVSTLLSLERVSLQTALGTFLLQDVSCVVRAGETVGLVGASGSGKTSLLRLLNGLVAPHTGEISFASRSFRLYEAVELRRRLVLVPQEPKLLGMKVIEALGYPLQLQQRSPEEIQTQIETWTKLLRIPSEWMAKTELQLSLGQRQLVAIARALMMQPQVILLDEPTSALDVGIATHLLKVLKQLNQSQQLTIVIVNHQLELIHEFCDRLLLLDRGLLVADMQATPDNWRLVREQISQLQLEEEREWS